MKRYILSALVAALILATSATEAIAADSGPHPTVLPLVVTNAGFIAPPEILAGRYEVSLENFSNRFVTADFVRIPEGLTVEDVQADTAAPVPEWAGGAPASAAPAAALEFAGGVAAPAHGTGKAILALSEGSWAVFTAGAGPQAPSATILVTGTAASEQQPVIPAAVELDLAATSPQDGTLLEPGRSWWSVTNTGDQVASLAVFTAPIETSPDVLLDELSTAAPGYSGDIRLLPNAVTGTGLLSPGVSTAISVYLHPGTYLIVTLIPGDERMTVLPISGEVVTVG